MSLPQLNAVVSRHMSFALAAILLLYGCQSTLPSTQQPITPSAEHLHQKSAGGQELAPIPAVTTAIPYVPRPSVQTINDLFTVSVVQVPVRDVLFKLARDARLEMDVYEGVSGLVTLNAVDQTLPAIIDRLNEQTGLNIQLSGRRLLVQTDKPYWHNYPVDYVNLERFSQSSVMLANAVGRAGTQSQAVTLGGATQGQIPVSMQPGSSVAILNQTRHEVWNTLSRGVMRILQAMYPMLTPPVADSAAGGGGAAAASSGQGAAPTPDAAAVGASAAALSGLPAAGTVLPAPEMPLAGMMSASAAATGPYPEGAPVSNYVNIGREAGFISVYAPLRAHKEIQKFIDNMMAGSRRQVLIEATVVEVDLNQDSQAGINWSAIANDGTFGATQTFQGGTLASSVTGLVVTGADYGRAWTLGSSLKLLENYGNTKVLSSPKLVAINNQPSLLKVVENLVYFTVQAQVVPGAVGQASTRAYTTTPNTVPVGLVMSILPSINEHQEITLVVRPTISSQVGQIADPNPDLGNVPNYVPVIQEREMESVLKLQEGQVAILGGLMKDLEAQLDQGVPGLVGVPGVGYLFGQKGQGKRKSELVIFLRPTLVRNPDVEQGDLAGKRHLLPKLPAASMTGRGAP